VRDSTGHPMRANLTRVVLQTLGFSTVLLRLREAAISSPELDLWGCFPDVFQNNERGRARRFLTNSDLLFRDMQDLCRYLVALS
jgi:hypothetical protein